MEEERTNRHRKKKIIPFGNLTIGGEGGTTGLFMFGGALAFAGFMAVASFATQQNKAKRIHHHQPKPKQFLFDEDRCKSSEDNHDENTQSLIQHSTDQVGDDTCCGTSSPDSSSELLSESTQPLMEEKTYDNKFSSEEESPTCFNNQDIAFSDYSNQESTTSSNENQVTQEEEEKDEPQDGLTSTETEDDDDMKSDDVRETEEETEDDDDDEDTMKSNDVRETDEEDSLKAIGTMPMDCNEEPILMTVPKEATLNKNAKFSLVSNDQPSILTTWVKPMLLLALVSFTVLLTHGLREYLYVFDDGDYVLAP